MTVYVINDVIPDYVNKTICKYLWHKLKDCSIKIFIECRVK